ncbi:hypothetical protein, partial [Rhizobium leguminosarum]|uniref:hypothetical protein n=1 Tax=Rhizobium leguminosarum TaxID=384 RepID=UPI003F9AF227
GFDDVETFPRNFDWRDDEPATITYVQALDKGLGRSKSEFRDALYAITLPDYNKMTSSSPNSENLDKLLDRKKELFKTQRRLRNIAWGNNNLALVYQSMTFDRKMQMYAYNPSNGAMDLVYER